MSSRARGVTMGGSLGRRTLPVAFALLLLLNLVPVEHHEALDERTVYQSTAGDPGVSDVPTWRVGDRWITGTFDPTILVTARCEATVGEIKVTQP